MILVFKADASRAQHEAVLKKLKELSLDCVEVTSADASMIVVRSETRSLPGHLFSQLEGIGKVVRIKAPHPLAEKATASSVSLPSRHGPVTIGGAGSAPIVIAGPCSVESEKQIVDLAHSVRNAGASILRGGAFKPRTSPYDFSGLGREGLEHLMAAKKASGMPVISEILSAEQIGYAEDAIDILQVGARNMYNYELLKELGRQPKPVLLKRAMSATIDEFLQAAEYILLHGNSKIILCERGIRTFETATRNTLDLSAVAYLKQMTNLPVIVDPSHASGLRDLVRPLSLAAIACGADGIMIEVHADPDRSISDAAQAITPATLKTISEDIVRIAAVCSSRQEKVDSPKDNPERFSEDFSADLTVGASY